MSTGFNPKDQATSQRSLKAETLEVSGSEPSLFQILPPAGGSLASALGVAKTFAVLGASAVTNTGSSVLTGDLGIYPGTGSSVTGFPPGTFSGQAHFGDTAAQQAQAAALAAFTAGNALTYTPIASNLNGQTLTPGNYSESSGTFNLAAAGAGTLTLNGAGNYYFKAASTLVTGAGGTPTITLTNGASAANIYWLVGSSATINSGNTGVFNGNIIAQVSITDTLGGTVNGNLIALTGAVTLSAATISNAQPGALGACVVEIGEVVTAVQEANCKVDATNSQKEFQRASLTIVDSFYSLFTISNISVANPTVVTTNVPHRLDPGTLVTITGSNSTPSIDGTWNVIVTGISTFVLPVNVTVAGSAGTLSRPGGSDNKAIKLAGLESLSTADCLTVRYVTAK